MRKIFFLILSLVITAFFFGCSSPKTSFRKIEISYFTKDSTADSLLIPYYVSINKTGEVVLYDLDARNDTDYWPKYSTISLPDSILEILNHLFKGQKKLKDYEVETQLEKGHFFAGQYFYIRAEYDNNTADSLCTIRPFLNSEFNTSYDLAEEFFFTDDNNKKRPPLEIPALFKRSLRSAYRKCSHLPPITQPPPFTDEGRGRIPGR